MTLTNIFFAPVLKMQIILTGGHKKLDQIINFIQ